MPGGCVVICRAGDDTLENIVYGFQIRLLEGECFARAAHHTECLGEVSEIILGQLDRRRNDLLERPIPGKGEHLCIWEPLDVIAIPGFRRLGQELFRLALRYTHLFFEPRHDLFFGFAHQLHPVYLIGRRAGQLPRLCDPPCHVPDDVVIDWVHQHGRRVTIRRDLLRCQHSCFPAFLRSSGSSAPPG